MVLHRMSLHELPAAAQRCPLFCVLVALCTALASIAPVQADDSPTVAWHSMDGGGLTGGTDGAYRLSATVGQPDAGRTGGPSHVLTGGFRASPDELVFVLNLYTGWNLVSVPVTPSDPLVASVFGGVQQGAVWEYRGSHYAPAAHIRAGAAYWLHLPAAAACAVRGRRVRNRAVELAQDWNFVGPVTVPPYAAVPLPPETTPAQRAAMPVYEWDAGLQAYREAVQVEAGHGYLVWALDACLWEFP